MGQAQLQLKGTPQLHHRWTGSPTTPHSNGLLGKPQFSISSTAMPHSTPRTPFTHQGQLPLLGVHNWITWTPLLLRCLEGATRKMPHSLHHIIVARNMIQHTLDQAGLTATLHRPGLLQMPQ